VRVEDAPRDRLGRRRELVRILAAKLVCLAWEPVYGAEVERWCTYWQITHREMEAARKFARAILSIQRQIHELAQAGREVEAKAVSRRLRRRLERW